MQRKVGPYKFSQDVSMVKQQETETKTKKDEREKINELFKKIRKGEIKEVKKMLDEPSITLNSTDKDGNNPLHVAIDAKGKAWSLFKLLLGKSSETNTINMKNKEGFTPLHLAAIHNNDEIAVQLIEKQADMNKKDNDGLTPILTAASCDSSEVIEVLLQNGANLEDKNHQGNTIVHLATENGCVNVLELLLNRENMTRYKKIKKMLNADKDEEAPCQCENCKDEDCQNKDCENEDREDKECEDRQDTSCEGKDCKIGDSENKDCPNCSKEDSKSIDKDFARTPIGLAAYYGYLDCLKLLILHGANVHEKCKNLKTVLHLAAAQGNTGVVEQLIQDVPVLMYEEDDKQQTAIYDAIRYDQIVASLIKAGAYVNWWDYHTRTPLSYAAEKGFVGSTKILLRHGADYHWLDVNKRQPIHYAAENGHSEVFRIHASETSSEYTARDDKGENCFDLAIKNNHVETVLTMFQMERGKWEDLLRSRSSKFDTPMRRLIREMPDVARVVFDKCVRTDGNGDSFEVEFNYEFLDDTLHLGKWTISDINNEDDGDYQKDGDAKCNKDVKGDGDDIDGEEPYTDDLNLIKANHPLMIMVTSERTELLDHPLVSALIKKKWTGIGLIFQLLNFLLYAVYLAMLTGFALDIKSPFQFQNVSADAMKVCLEDNDTYQSIPVFASYAKYGVIIFAFIELFIEVVEMKQMFSCKVWLYFLEVENVIEWITCTTAIIFVANLNGCSDTGFRPQWQWSCGTVSVFLAWINMLFIIQKFEWFGIYVVMLFRVAKVFMKFFLVFFLLIVAFAVSFHGLFQNQEQFSTVWISVVKTTAMMIGEIDFGTIFFDEVVHYEYISYMFFYIFLMFMTIVLINLLVGLSVENIQEFQKEADLTKKEMQVKFALEVERISTSSLILKCLNFLRCKRSANSLSQKEKFWPNRQTWLQRKLAESWKLTEKDIKMALIPEKDGTSKEIARLDTKFNTLETNLLNMDSKLEKILQSLRDDWSSDYN